jgi:tRNA(Ile)-lysidine synthase
MASSRKPRSGELAAAVGDFLGALSLGKKRVAVGLSGGVDSVVLLHVLKTLQPKHGFALSALHVHHGLSPNADGWTRFCRAYCSSLAIPLAVRRVKVSRSKDGLEAAARRARYAAFAKSAADFLVLAHHLDDQAETVLMNLLRGAGARGASGMPARSTLAAKRGRKLVLRPLLGSTRKSIEAYARAERLEWIEDESNADEALTRNFVRRRLGPVLEERFPAWRENLARAARLFSRRELGADRLLRQFLAAQGLRAPSEARLVEMLKQLTSEGKRTLLEHDGARLRKYRGKVLVDALPLDATFSPLRWQGERRVPIPSLHGELSFKRARGKGIAFDSSAKKLFTIQLRTGGERLQPDARRPRRTLKNLFQEAGVPSWERERLPMLFCGDDLVWVPGLGIDVRYQVSEKAQGLVPEWRR